MHKIGDDTSTADVNNEFTEGQAGGDPATIVKANWLNAVQKELIELLAQANITPNNTTYNQIYAAMQVLFPQFDDLATTSLAGLIELATNAEAQAKISGSRALTPANLSALLASTTFAGLIELATNAEAQAKTSGNRALTPANLAAMAASTTFAGLVELATNAEAIAKTVSNRAITPANLGAIIKGDTFVYNSTNNNQLVGSAAYPNIQYDTEVRDPAGFFNPAVDNTLFTVPAGVSLIEIDALMYFDNNSPAGDYQLTCNKNNLYYTSTEKTFSANAHPDIPLHIPRITVTPGDFFRFTAGQFSGGNLFMEAGVGFTWVNIKVIE